jgi:hypothetical protein
MWCIGQAARRSGRPLYGNPEGRAGFRQILRSSSRPYFRYGLRRIPRPCRNPAPAERGKLSGIWSNVRPPSRRTVHPAGVLRLQPGECGLGQADLEEISQGPRAVGRHPADDARAGAGGLGHQGGDRDDRRHARHALYPRAGSRDLLHASRSAARRPACCAARKR